MLSLNTEIYILLKGAGLMGRKIIQASNICALCQGKYPSSALYTCGRCGLRYCGNCVLFGDGGVICLRCAVKRVTPRTRESKYMKLGQFLARRAGGLSEITLSFYQIEEIIGERLPESARTRKTWWSNIRGRMPSEAWLTVGWAVKEVDLKGKMVRFIRETEPKKEAKRKTTEEAGPEFKALAFKARATEITLRKKRPSKTKLAMLQARLKNIERQRRGRP